MTGIWILLIITSLLCIIWIIFSDEKSLALTMSILFTGGIGWGLVGNLLEVKSIEYNVSNKCKIERTTLKTYVSYGDTELKLDDVKSYRFLNLENCKIYIHVKINMYNSIIEKELIVKYNTNIE